MDDPHRIRHQADAAVALENGPDGLDHLVGLPLVAGNGHQDVAQARNTFVTHPALATADERLYDLAQRVGI